MALLKLKLASFIVLEDDCNRNLLPIISELVKDDNLIKFLCYEYPPSLWLNMFKNKKVIFYDESNFLTLSHTKDKSAVIIDSVNQMAIDLGWGNCIKHLKKFSSEPSITKLIVVLHKDCILPGSNLQRHLNHIANAIVSCDACDPCKIKIHIKTGGKLFKSEEFLTYDNNTSVLTSTPIKVNVKEEPVEKVLPGDITTFKIEVDQLNQLAKHQLKLPYMSKIHEGQGKVYYEPDAVDDWDDEDPDDDLDI